MHINDVLAGDSVRNVERYIRQLEQTIADHAKAARCPPHHLSGLRIQLTNKFLDRLYSKLDDMSR
jgi:flagellar biosynthesis chaperone FliJ